MGRESIPGSNNTPSKRMIAYLMGRLLGKQFITMAWPRVLQEGAKRKNALLIVCTFCTIISKVVNVRY